MSRRGKLALRNARRRSYRNIEEDGANKSELDPRRLMATRQIAGINEQQKLFCVKYVETMDITESYLYAYPDAQENSALTSGHRLLKKDYVKQYINGLIDEYSDEIDITAAALLKEMNKIAFSDVEVRSSDKLKAIQLLGQGKGLFAEKVEVTNKTITIIPSFED